MPGGAPLPDGITLTSIANTLGTGTIEEIRALGSALAEYNESGDDEEFDPSMPPTGGDNSADPQGAKSAGSDCADMWDTPVISATTAAAQGNNGKAKGKNK